MGAVDYDHSQNHHTLAGPSAALPVMFAEGRPASLLDVGCGTGTWLRAAMDLGIKDVCGIDGVNLGPSALPVPAEFIRLQDLTSAWSLRRRFDVVLCLEVAEHLPRNVAAVLVGSLAEHSHRIIFSAACPGQE